MFKTSRFAFKHPSQKFSQKSIKQPVSSQKKLIVLLKKLLSANFIHKIKSFPKALLFYFFNSTWHTPDLKLQNLMPFNNYKLRVWASEPHTMLMHYRSEPKTEYECRFSYDQIRIIWIESSCISEFRRRWSENFVPWHSRSHRARIQVPFINYINRFLKLSYFLIYIDSALE